MSEKKIFIEEIGYFKYYPSNSDIADCIREYPINEEILSYIRKTGIFKLEYDGTKPKKINGKYIVLI